VIERSRVQLPAAALSGNDLGQVVHTNVPLFTKSIIQYLARAFMSTRLYVAANVRDPMNKGSIVKVKVKVKEVYSC